MLQARHNSKGIAAAVAGVAALLCIAPGVSNAQQNVALPFAMGETLTFTGHTDLLGKMGRGAMWIEGPADMRGVSAWVLRFDFKAGVAPFGSSERTTSWFDAVRILSLRFEKHTRKFLGGEHKVVELFPEQRRWTEAKGSGGESLSSHPLDELSFIYFIRTLPLEMDSTYTFERHFDAARNPTLVKVVGRETIETPAGTFSTLKVEMIVRDARNYDKEGTIRFFLSDDERRIPVRIQSMMPGVGLATLTLETHNVPALLPRANGGQ